MRIISAYGDSLSPEAWSICIKSVIFRLLSSIEDELRAASEQAPKERRPSDWKETAIVVIQGVSGLFVSYLGVLATHRGFAAVWRDLFAHFGSLLEVQILDINTATYSAIRDILHRCAEADKPQVGKEGMDIAWELWSQGIPVPRDSRHDKSSDNQKCLLVWVETLLELYGLIQKDFSVERVRRMLTLLRDAMQHATPGAYASDIEQVTPLQGSILKVFGKVRMDIPGVPSALITQVAEFVSLAFSQENPAKSAAGKRTFVAMSKESMSILQSLIITNASDLDIYRTEAFATALSALTKPVSLKYHFKITTKSSQPWREATKSALAVLSAALPHIHAAAPSLPRPTLHAIWPIIVTLATGILSADCTAAPPGTDILADQAFDISAFHQLRDLIIPALGSDTVPEPSRKTYAHSLFLTSLIHAPSPADAAAIATGTSTLPSLLRPARSSSSRPGRTVDPPPTPRRAMSDVCLDELFSLVQVQPAIHIHPPTPGLPPKAGMTLPGGGGGDTAQNHIRLARTAAPYLMMRSALTLRAYATDQPLRGRMPQPLTQRREVGRVLRCLVGLRSEGAAIPDVDGAESETRKHLLRLYPLLVVCGQVAGTSGDDGVLGLVREALDVVGGELGV